MTYDMNCSPRLHPYVIFPMVNPEAVLRTNHDPSFETVMNEPNDDVLVSAWELALNDEIGLWTGEGTAAAMKEVPSKVDHLSIKSCRIENDNVTEREVKLPLRN